MPKVEFTTRLTREDVAGIIEALTEGLKEGVLKVHKSGETLALDVPRVVNLEIEASVDEERAKFEIEVSWRPHREENPDTPDDGEMRKKSRHKENDDQESKEAGKSKKESGEAKKQAKKSVKSAVSTAKKAVKEAGKAVAASTKAAQAAMINRHVRMWRQRRAEREGAFGFGQSPQAHLTVAEQEPRRHVLRRLAARGFQKRQRLLVTGREQQVVAAEQPVRRIVRAEGNARRRYVLAHRRLGCIDERRGLATQLASLALVRDLHRAAGQMRGDLFAKIMRVRDDPGDARGARDEPDAHPLDGEALNEGAADALARPRDHGDLTLQRRGARHVGLPAASDAHGHRRHRRTPRRDGPGLRHR